MGCGSSKTGQVQMRNKPQSKAKQEVIENYQKKKKSGGTTDKKSVTRLIIKNSKPGAHSLLSTQVIMTKSQTDFFKMLDDKVERGENSQKEKHK